jgi:mono/diheme cytochrome c family protein
LPSQCSALVLSCKFRSNVVTFCRSVLGMNPTRSGWLAAGALAAIVTTAGVTVMRAQDADKGEVEFLLNCAGCHGTDGKGSGSQSAKLDAKPTDLTLLAEHNHGRFDAGAIYQKIDGRNVRSSHHNAGMPIFGCRHQSSPPPKLPPITKRNQKIPKRLLSQLKSHETELDSLLDMPCDSETDIKERILSIVSYLSLIQAK